MAAALSEAPSTVNSWKAAGRIPAHHQPKVLSKARELGLVLTVEDMVFPLGSLGSSDRPQNPGPETGKFDKISGSESRPFTAPAQPEMRP
jgi:hypothetical protein